MKIAIFSWVFAPNSGGSGVVARLLAREMQNLGNEVRVVTQTKAIGEDKEYNFEVIRDPKGKETICEVSQADGVILIGPMTASALFALIKGKPVVVSHQMFRPSGWRRIRDATFHHRFLHIAPSTAVAAQLPEHWRMVKIPNPYDADLFHDQELGRRKDISYVGRLVPEKGADECIRAFAAARLDPATKLHIFGGGSAEAQLKKEVSRMSLDHRVLFHGDLPPNVVAFKSRSICVQVVPSRWEEPFGIVALEALASGCRLIVTRRGGLLEASGGHAFTYESGDVAELSRQMERAFKAAIGGIENSKEQLELHLSRHHPRSVAVRYLDLLETEIAGTI